MEKKVKEFLEVSQDESEAVSRIVVSSQKRPGCLSFYEDFAVRGIRVDRVEPGLVVSTFKVPPRLTDRAGNLAKGLPMTVSVDISISYMSTAKLDDELEIISKRLGQKGAYSGTLVLLRNKATGEVIAEGRHSLFLPQHTPKL